MSPSMTVIATKCHVANTGDADVSMEMKPEDVPQERISLICHTSHRGPGRGK